MTTIFAAANHRLVAGVLVAVALAIIAILMIASTMISHRRRSAVPHALRPGPSDEELEARTLPRFLAIGSVLLLFLSIYLPAYWLREPTRIRLVNEKFTAQQLERGKTIFEAPVPGAPHFSANCARCHGPQGEGTIQSFKEIYSYAEPPLAYIVARYKAAGRNDDEIRQLMTDAIERGRPGTLMPTWGLLYGGPLNAQQVQDVVAFIYSIQKPFPTPEANATGEQLFLANCNTCHSRADLTDATTGSVYAHFPVASGGVGPDLREVMSQLTIDDIIATIKNGRTNYTRPSMPTWAALGDKAIGSIVDFLRSIQTSGVKPNIVPPHGDPCPPSVIAQYHLPSNAKVPADDTDCIPTSATSSPAPAASGAAK